MAARPEQGSFSQQLTRRVRRIISFRKAGPPAKSPPVVGDARVRKGLHCQAAVAAPPARDRSASSHGKVESGLKPAGWEDVRPPPELSPANSFGYLRNFELRYDRGRELGRGGNGVVRLVRDRTTGRDYACKSIPKVLSERSGASIPKRAGHAQAIQREVEVLQRYVHMPMPLCSSHWWIAEYADSAHRHLLQQAGRS